LEILPGLVTRYEVEQIDAGFQHLLVIDVFEQMGDSLIQWHMLQDGQDMLNNTMYKSIRGLVETEVERQKRVIRVMGPVENRLEKKPVAPTSKPVNSTKGKKRDIKKG